MNRVRWVAFCLALFSLAACVGDYHPPELDPATNVIHDGHSCNG